MTHSPLTQWIEEADARQFCQAASWSEVPPTPENNLGETILKMPAAIGSYALARIRRIASVCRAANPERQI